MIRRETCRTLDGRESPMSLRVKEGKAHRPGWTLLPIATEGFGSRYRQFQTIIQLEPKMFRRRHKEYVEDMAM